METVDKCGSARELAWEATGLRWLAEPGVLRVAKVIDVSNNVLTLERIATVAPTPAAAEVFGRQLAALHASADATFGSAPTSWEGDGFLGPSDDLLSLPLRSGTWGAVYAAQLRAIADVATQRGRLPSDLAALVDRVADRLVTGELDDDAAPARLHGDLWTGNVLWSADGAVLIDPAAHIGHPLLDLALLDLFGIPYQERIFAAYSEVADLPEGWRDRLRLHQGLHLVLHVACFGNSYVPALQEALAPWG